MSQNAASNQGPWADPENSVRGVLVFVCLFFCLFFFLLFYSSTYLTEGRTDPLKKQWIQGCFSRGICTNISKETNTQL